MKKPPTTATLDIRRRQLKKKIERLLLLVVETAQEENLIFDSHCFRSLSFFLYRLYTHGRISNSTDKTKEKESFQTLQRRYIRRKTKLQSIIDLLSLCIVLLFTFKTTHQKKKSKIVVVVRGRKKLERWVVASRHF